jgi:hypothetical protein
MEDDRPEKLFECFRTMFLKPETGLGLRCRGGQNAFLLSSLVLKTTRPANARELRMAVNFSLAVISCGHDHMWSFLVY